MYRHSSENLLRQLGLWSRQRMYAAATAPRVNRMSAYAYSSLRNPRQYGPRSRILNHVDNLRPARPVKLEQRAATAPMEAQSTYIEQDDHFATDPAHTPVVIPPQAGAVITPDYHGAPILSQSALVVGREIEMMNIFLGYEQANRYKIMDPNGNQIGYIAEEEGFMKSLSRQFMRTHRHFNATIMDPQGNVVFKIVRPFAFINSRIFIYTSDDQLVGEVQQRWHLLRRKYDLFVGNTQFAYVDTPFLGWDFNLQDQDGGYLGNVSRNFMGFAREIFTDTGQYVLRMDAMEDNSRGLTLDERAVTLACAISIDFDYFSRHSQHAGGGFLPIPFPFFGYGSEREVGTDQTSQTQVPPSPTGPDQTGSQMGSQMGGQQVNQNEYGDEFLSDEESGISSFVDNLKDIFKDE